MLLRILVLAGLLHLSAAIFAQTYTPMNATMQVALAHDTPRDEFEQLSSLVLGAFEFPLSGKFEIERQGMAMVLSPVAQSPDSNMVITTRVVNKPVHAPNAKQHNIAALESQLIRNWFQVATMRNGKIVTPFERTTFEDGTVLYWMSTEFDIGYRKLYHLNFAVTDGAQIASLVFEGVGGAEDAERKIRQYIVPLKYRP